MIVAETKTPTNEDFKELMSKTDNYLNKLALEEPSLFKEHGGLKLEGDILSALNVMWGLKSGPLGLLKKDENAQRVVS